jgi:hypothetical protein
VSWWPGNVDVGGTHIHHLVWGILLLLICGYIGVAIHPGDPWREFIAVGFGIGTGLTLDEFALWLNLKDVYWSKQGRRSIDAVIVAAAVAGICAGRPARMDRRDHRGRGRDSGGGRIDWSPRRHRCARQCREGEVRDGDPQHPGSGRRAPGAFRLAKPRSVWAKLFYRRDKLERSEARFAGSRGEPFWTRG